MFKAIATSLLWLTSLPVCIYTLITYLFSYTLVLDHWSAGFVMMSLPFAMLGCFIIAFTIDSNSQATASTCTASTKTTRNTGLLLSAIDFDTDVVLPQSTTESVENTTDIWSRCRILHNGWVGWEKR